MKLIFITEILKNEIADKIGHTPNDKEFQSCMDSINYYLSDSKKPLLADVETAIEYWIKSDMIQCQFCQEYFLQDDEDTIKQDNNGMWCCESLACRGDADFSDPDALGDFLFRASREDKNDN